MKIRIRMFCTALITVLAVATTANAEDDSDQSALEPVKRAEEHYNLSRDGLAIQGYDPVSYFEEGGGTPLAGLDDFQVTLGKTKYYFASKENKALFEADPTRYEPAYGGWCAYAMGLEGEKVKINPKSFTITDGRLCLFYKTFFTDTRTPWIADAARLKQNADRAWEKITGEKARPSPADADEGGESATP